MCEIKELNQRLIHIANSNSFNGTRGDSSNNEYLKYAEKIKEFEISDDKKQKLLDTLYKKWCVLLNYEAQHVSVMYAGPAKYNAKKLDKSDKILKTASEIYNWFKDIENQCKSFLVSPKSKADDIIEDIEYYYSKGYSVNKELEKLVSIDKQEFKRLYEKINAEKPFRKNSNVYKLYANLDKIQENKKDVFFESEDMEAYTEGDRAYIKFTLKPKRQLIVALKSRKWWWNSYVNAWSTYLSKLDKEWVKTIPERYKDYI